MIRISKLGVAPAFPSVRNENILPKPALSLIIEPVDTKIETAPLLNIKRANEFIAKTNKHNGFSEAMKVARKIKQMVRR